MYLKLSNPTILYMEIPQRISEEKPMDGTRGHWMTQRLNIFGISQYLGLIILNVFNAFIFISSHDSIYSNSDSEIGEKVDGWPVLRLDGPLSAV